VMVREAAWAERAYDGADLPRAAIGKVLELDPRGRTAGWVLIGVLWRAGRGEDAS